MGFLVVAWTGNAVLYRAAEPTLAKAERRYRQMRDLRLRMGYTTESESRAEPRGARSWVGTHPNRESVCVELEVQTDEDPVAEADNDGD